MYKQQQERIYIGSNNQTKPVNQLPIEKQNKFNELYTLFLINDYDTIINSFDDINNTNIFQLNNEDNETLIFAILKNESGDLTELQKLFIIEKLVLKNISVNINSFKNDQNPLHFACMKKYMNIIKYLVDKGCDQNKLDNFGKAPIHYFAENLVYDCVQGYDFYDSANMSRKDICKPTKTELLLDYVFIDTIQESIDKNLITKYIGLNKFYRAKEIQDLVDKKYTKLNDELLKNNYKDEDLIKKSIFNELLSELKELFNKYKIDDCSNDEDNNKMYKIQKDLMVEKDKYFKNYNDNFSKLIENINELNGLTLNSFYGQFVYNLNYIFAYDLMENGIDIDYVFNKNSPFIKPETKNNYYNKYLKKILIDMFKPEESTDPRNKEPKKNINMKLVQDNNIDLPKDAANKPETNPNKWTFDDSIKLIKDIKKKINIYAINSLYIKLNREIMTELLYLNIKDKKYLNNWKIKLNNNILSDIYKIPSDNYYSVYANNNKYISTIVEYDYDQNNGPNTNPDYDLLYSNDGIKWEKKNKMNIQKGNFNSVYIDGDYAIAGGDNGLWYSIDQGIIWEKSTSLEDITKKFNSVFMIGQNAIAGGDTGLWYSNNYGKIWERVISDVVIKSVYMNERYAVAGGNDYLYFSTDNCANWYGDRTSQKINSVCINGMNTIIGCDDGIIVITNFNTLDEWIPTPNAVNDTNRKINSVYMVGENAIAGSNNGLWYSSNLSNWTYCVGTTGKINSVYMLPTRQAIAVGDSGLWYSIDNGQNWKKYITNDTFYSVYMKNNYAIAGSSSNSGLWLSKNYGETWTNLTDNNTGDFKSVCINDRNNAIAGGVSNNGIWYSDKLEKLFNQSVVNSNNINSTFNSVCMVYANAIAGSDKGLWYSNNSGQNWNLSTFVDATKNINIKFNSVYIVYIGSLVRLSGYYYAIAGSDNGLWYSTNGGQTWNLSTAVDVNTNINIKFNSVYMVGQNAIACSNNGLWYSNNSGQTWNLSTAVAGVVPTINIPFNSVYMVNANAIACSNNGLWYSNNSGQTWNLSTAVAGVVPTINIPFNSVYMVNANAIAGSNSGLWYSNDSGATWNLSTAVILIGGIVPNINIKFNSVYMVGENAIAGSNVVAGATDNYGLWYSTDSGTTWRQSKEVNGNTQNINLQFNSVYMVDENAIAGGVNNLVYLNNSLITWNKQQQVYINNNNTFNSVYIVDENAIACSNNYGLFYSIDNGLNWTQSINTDRLLMSGTFNYVYMVGANAIACSGNTGLWYSINSGQTWTQSTAVRVSGIIPNINIQFNSVYMVGENAIACSGSNTGLWYSTNYGQTWTQSNKTDNTFNSVYMVGTNAIAGSGINNSLWYSVDSGQTWIQSKNNTNGLLMTVNINSVFMNTNYAIAGGNGLWSSNNSGQTWTIVNGTDRYTFNSVYMFNNYAIAGFNDGYIISDNFGQNWNTLQTQNPSINFLSVYMIKNKIIMGTNNGLWYSNNYGEDWTKSEENKIFNSVCMNDNNIIAGGNNGLYYSSDNLFKFSQVIQQINTFKFISLSDDNAIASKMDEGLWYSIDNCTNWIQSNINYGNFYSAYIIGQNAIAGSDNLGLWYSINGGQTWILSDKKDNSFKTVYMVGQYAIAGSYTDSGLWYSSNSGQTWIQSNNTTDNFNSIYMFRSNAIAGGYNGIWYSRDSGQTWTKSTKTYAIDTENKNLVEIFNSINIGGDIAIAGSTNGIWFSQNIGETWTQCTINDVPINGVFNAIYIDDTTFIAAGNNGLLYSVNGKEWEQCTNINNDDVPIIGVFNSVSSFEGIFIAGGDKSTGIWYSNDFGRTWTQSNIKNILSMKDETYCANIIVPDTTEIQDLFKKYNESFNQLSNLKFNYDLKILNKLNYLEQFNFIEFNVYKLRDFLDENINNLYMLCSYVYNNINKYLKETENNYKIDITFIKQKFNNFKFTDDDYNKSYSEFTDYFKMVNNIYNYIKNIFGDVNKIIENGNKIMSIEYIIDQKNINSLNKFNLISTENFSDSFDTFNLKYTENNNKFKEYLISNFFMKITNNNYNIITENKSISSPTIPDIKKDVDKLKKYIDNLIIFINNTYYYFIIFVSKLVTKNNATIVSIVSIKDAYYDCNQLINLQNNNLINLQKYLTDNSTDLNSLKKIIEIIKNYDYLKKNINNFLTIFKNFIKSNSNNVKFKQTKFSNFFSNDKFNSIYTPEVINLDSIISDKIIKNANVDINNIIKNIENYYIKKLIESYSIYSKKNNQLISTDKFFTGYNTNFDIPQTSSIDYLNKIFSVPEYQSKIDSTLISKYYQDKIDSTITPFICVENIDILLCKNLKTILDNYNKDIIIDITKYDKISDKILTLFNNIKKDTDNYKKFFEKNTKLAITLYIQEQIYIEIIEILKLYPDKFSIANANEILLNTKKKLYNKEITKHFIKYDDTAPKLNKGTSRKLIRGKCYSNPELLTKMNVYGFDFYIQDVNKSTILFYLIDERNIEAIKELIKLKSDIKIITIDINNKNLTPIQYIEQNIQLLQNKDSNKMFEEKFESFQRKLIKLINSNEEFGDIGISNSSNIVELLTTIITNFKNHYKLTDSTNLEEFDKLYKNFVDLDKYEDCEFNTLNYFMVDLLRNDLCNEIIDKFKENMIQYIYNNCKKDSEELITSNINIIKDFLYVCIYSKLKIENPDITYKLPTMYITELTKSFKKDVPELETCVENVLKMYKILVEQMSEFLYKNMIDISNDMHEIYLLQQINKTLSN
jgi:photosystem II stability/assembly factor-like uncharacterized protein